MKRTVLSVLVILLAMLVVGCATKEQAQTNITPDEARAIAREAYTYGFPIAEAYNTLYKQAVDTSNSDFKAPINQIGHSRGVASPQDNWVVTPNSDTPYSFLWADSSCWIWEEPASRRLDISVSTGTGPSGIFQSLVERATGAPAPV